MFNITERILIRNPDLKNQLRIAGINKTPENFVNAILVQVVLFTSVLTFLLYTFLVQMELPLILLSGMIVLAFMIFKVLMASPKAKLKKIERDIDKEILFAGTYLLVKIHSGKPLMNALADATKSYGAMSRYFRQIVHEIDTGTPIEEAIQKELDRTPSEKFKKILFQINNALKLGIDVSVPLKSVLDEIQKQQRVEITKYGKKLNSIVMFYMLGAIVVPSLGITMVVVILGLLSITIDQTTFIAAIVVLIVVQIAFINLFKMIKPAVDL